MSKFITVDGREFEFSARGVTNKDAILLETITGKRYADLVDDLEQGGPVGRAAFLWYAMRKNGCHVKYEDLEFPMGATRFIVDEPDPTEASHGTPTEDSLPSNESMTSDDSIGPPSPPR